MAHIIGTIQDLFLFIISTKKNKKHFCIFYKDFLYDIQVKDQTKDTK